MLRALIAQMLSPDEPVSQQQLAWIEQGLNAVWAVEGNDAEITSLYTHLRKSDDSRQRDMADALIAVLCKSAGCEATATLDRDASKSIYGMELIP